MNRKALVLFRRDLRLEDHLALLAAANESRSLLACFILDPVQVKPHLWQSRPGLGFMVQALLRLHGSLTDRGSGLLLQEGDPATVLADLISREGIDAVYVNRDYTPYARKRDQMLADCCTRMGVSLHWYDDALLNAPGALLNGQAAPYRVFTPFFKAAQRIPVVEPQKLPAEAPLVPFSAAEREHVRLRLAELGEASDCGVGDFSIIEPLNDLQMLSDYAGQRDFPALGATSHLSVHLKFGTISVREAYALICSVLGPEHPLLRQLYWRDFFTHIAWFFPHVFGHAFDRRFDQIAWSRDEKHFKAWCEGRTGFPIVDAGMRELQQSGFMHNRLRMITASFLVKDLHLPWRWGESWFARHLVDYDPALNNGNWQWAASTGCDAQPWFRIFNPWRQQQRFDPECIYIKRWLPELQDIDCRLIHDWAHRGDAQIYPLPMVDHAQASSISKQLFRQAMQETENE